MIRGAAGVASLPTGGCISALKGLHLCLQGVAFPPSRGCISETHEVALLSSGGCIAARRGLHKGLHRFLSRGCIGILSLVKGLHRGFHFSPQGGSPLAGGCIRGCAHRGFASKQAAGDSQPPLATVVIITAYRMSADKFSNTGWHESCFCILILPGTRIHLAKRTWILFFSCRGTCRPVFSRTGTCRESSRLRARTLSPSQILSRNSGYPEKTNFLLMYSFHSW